MEHSPSLSVIIPVYKVEDYLERCVMSVVNQNYAPLEIILVDDGSPDRCPQICDELAQRDERIRVIHKANGGLSSARNAGIDAARGDYLTFLDSDDQWNSGKLPLVMEKVASTTAPMCIFRSMSLYEDGTLAQRQISYYRQEIAEIRTEELYPQMIAEGNMCEAASTKILKRDFVMQHGFYFKPGIISEDVEWMFRVLRKVSLVALVDIPLYIYTENRPGSITQTASVRSVRDTLSIIKDSINFYQLNPDGAVRQWELAQCAYLWSIALGIYHNVSRKEAVSLCKELKETRKALDLSAHPKSQKVGLLYNILGLSLTSTVLGCYIKLLQRRMVNKKTKVNG